MSGIPQDVSTRRIRIPHEKLLLMNSGSDWWLLHVIDDGYKINICIFHFISCYKNEMWLFMVFVIYIYKGEAVIGYRFMFISYRSVCMICSREW